MASFPAGLHSQRHSVISRSSSPSLSDDDDAITPVDITGPSTHDDDDAVVPAAAQLEAAEEAVGRRRGSTTSSKIEVCGDRPWHFEPTVESEQLDTKRLWERMLAVQRRFKCYNSSRMNAALEDESVHAVVPSRACLDLLNDSITQLSDEDRKKVTAFIQHGDARRVAKKRSAWRRAGHGAI